MPRSIKFRNASGAKGKRIDGLTGKVKLGKRLHAMVNGKQVVQDSFHLTAYTGKPVRLFNFSDPVIVDLKGVRFARKVTPIIADHNTSLRIGHTTEQTVVTAGQSSKFGNRKITGPMIAVDAVRSSDMAIAKGFVRDAKLGFPFQASIGADVDRAYFVEEDETVEVNGVEYSGPLVVAAKTTIREISITVLGADGDTQAIVAAQTQESFQMKFSEWLKSLGLSLSDLSPAAKVALKAKWQREQNPDQDLPPKKKVKAARQDPDEDDDEPEEPTDPLPAKQKVKASRQQADDGLSQHRQSLADETERVDRITEIAAEFSDTNLKVFLNGKKKGEEGLNLSQVKLKAIKEKWTPDQFELTLRRAEYPSDPSTPAIHVISRDVNSAAIECAILRAAGTIPMSDTNRITGRKYGIEMMFDEETLELSDRRQNQVGLQLSNLMRLQIAASGGHAGHMHNEDLWVAAHKSWSSIQASGFSTISVTNILENVAHKASLASFESVESVWRYLCGRRPVSDFKAHSLYRLDYSGSYRKVAADGELKHVSMVDTKKTLQAETYGAMITIDRKTQVNDDLAMIVEKARGIGTLGAQRIEESVMVLLLSNPSSFFSAGNGNYQSGGGSALSITSLTTAKQAFVDQTINGKPISVSPSIMLVGSALWETANRLYTQGQMALTTTADTPKFSNNPHVGLYRPYMSPYLNNTSVLDQDGAAISGQSATKWYLFGNPSAPQGSALVIGFLNGRETPYFDQAATQFSVPGGIQFRSYHDWAVAMHITQLGYLSAGA